MRIPALFALTAALVWTSSSLGQMLLTGSGSAGGSAAPPSGSCSQSTAFLGRAGSIDTAHHNAYDAFICNGVTDGWWSKMDAFYLFGAQTSSQAVLNLVQSSFGITSTVMPAFVADVGAVLDATTTYMNTNFVPSTAGGHYLSGSASFGVCKIPTGGGNSAEGVYDGSIVTQMFWAQSGGGTVDVFVNNIGGATVTVPTAIHLWTMSRTTSTLMTFYQDGSALTPTDTSSATTLPSKALYLGARNNNGSPLWFDGSTLYAAFLGGGLTATDVGNIHTRLHAYTGTLGTAQC